MKFAAMLACLSVAGCGHEYNDISSTQCTDWREVSGFTRDNFSGGYRSIDEIICVVKDQKTQGPK